MLAGERVRVLAGPDVPHGAAGARHPGVGGAVGTGGGGGVVVEAARLIAT